MRRPTTSILYRPSNPNMVCPRGNDPDGLFAFVVTRVLMKRNKFLMHNQWANLIFGNATAENVQRLTLVASHFATFIERGPNRTFKWKLEEIHEAHPRIFQTLRPAAEKLSPADELSQLQTALRHEIREAIRSERKSKYPIAAIVRVTDRGRGQIHQVTLELKEDDDPKLMEGQPVKIISEGGTSVEATVLEFDNDSSSVFVDLKGDHVLKIGKKTLVVETVWLLQAMLTALEAINLDGVRLSGFPINKFLEGACLPSRILEEISRRSSQKTNLDDSQQEAIEAALSNDISLIWGPPGTGKSTTLAEIILELFLRGERTLVTGIANVAVDAIAAKFVKTLSDEHAYLRWVSDGQILRVGYCKNDELLRHDFLFPKGPAVEQIKSELSELFERLKDKHLSGEQVRLIKVAISEKKNRLKDATDKVITSANLLFATSTKATVDSNINDMEIDNLIIDEASMMSVPVFMAMAVKVRKRIIICGDFRQLGPIALAQTEIARKWLHRDLFQYAGVRSSSSPNHPALKLLNTQRRFPYDVCELINGPFYEGKLKTQYDHPDSMNALNAEPFAGRPITYIPCKTNEPFKAEKTRNHSRKNEGSIELLLQVVTDILANNKGPSIGIITPYRGQVKRIEQEIKKMDLNEHERSCIKVGTIHSFQGSEKEWIILDLVESAHLKVGRLYRLDEGKRLLNVAISRTRAKLIVVGDLDVFSQGKGSNSVDFLVRKVAEKIRGYGVRGYGFDFY